MHAHDYERANQKLPDPPSHAGQHQARRRVRPAQEAREGLTLCPCGAQATTREGGRGRCGPRTDRRIADVAAQARARAKADAHVGSLLSIGLVWLVAGVLWAIS